MTFWDFMDKHGFWVAWTVIMTAIIISNGG
jgi:hypothetical protein